MFFPLDVPRVKGILRVQIIAHVTEAAPSLESKLLRAAREGNLEAGEHAVLKHCQLLCTTQSSTT